jgi:ATP-dependent Clp protease ATP-binding subunit ClpA
MSFQFRHQFVGVEHLLFSLLEYESAAGTQILKKIQVNRSKSESSSKRYSPRYPKAAECPDLQKYDRHTRNLFNGSAGAIAGMRPSDDYHDAYQHKGEKKEQMKS